LDSELLTNEEEEPPDEVFLKPPDRKMGSAWPSMRRLLRRSRPYLMAIVLVALSSTLFAASRYTRAYLVKPLLDEVMVPVASIQQADPSEPDSAASDPTVVSTPPLLPLETTPPVSDREANQHAAPGTTPDADPDAAREAAPEGTLEANGAPAASDPAGDREIVERMISNVQPRLIELGFIAILTLIATPIAIFGRAYASNWIVGRVRQDIDQEIARKFLAAPLAIHRESSSGDLLARAMNDGQLAVLALALIYRDMMTNGVMILVGVGTMFIVSWQLALLALTSVPALLLVLGYFGRRIHKQTRRRQETQGELAQRLVGILSGIKVIKAFRGQEVEEAAFARETEKYFRRYMKVIFNRVMGKATTEALTQTAGFVVLAVGAWMAITGVWGITLGVLAAFLMALVTTYKPVKSIFVSYANVMESIAGADRLFELLDGDEEPPDRKGARPMRGLRESIRFRDVHFGYGNEEVLRGIDLEVKPGEVIAVVGRTGTGKSTLMDLLLRFHDPTRGAVEIDGVDLRDLQRNSFLDHVAVVTQEPFLFDETILENIRYGRPEATLEDVKAAAAAARADEFIDQLPEGYDTPVGEFGLRLSGGQRQRLTIARAILRNPALLVFDEATSALDAKTERAVQAAIEALRGQRTIFLVAHRLSTIQHADRIIVIDEGRIAEIGDHETLMRQPGLYRELVGHQSEPHEG